MSRLVYVNGKFVPEKDAAISIYDSALMFGDMVFDMTRSYNKKQFKLREHLERLFRSMDSVNISIDLSIDEMEKACLETIEKNEPFFEDSDEHRLMINVSRGPLAIYGDVFGGKIEPTIIIADFPLKWTVRGMDRLFETGINAIITSQKVIPENLMDPKIKNRSRLFYMMANIEVSKHDGKNNWALLLDPDNYIAEGTGANFFLVKDDVIYTPEPRNVLVGISRKHIFDIAKKLGIKCYEKNLTVDDALNADEAFFTGTPFAMLPVTSINNKLIGNGKKGKIFLKLISEWSKIVGVDIPVQIKNFNDELDNNLSGPSPYQFKSKIDK
jgi:branched-chain amino acid aminotransferase|tara:strand:+ start:715 stop:1695 length:981 start_codon:yes stop_codon:yes gene_type:complete